MKPYYPNQIFFYYSYSYLFFFQSSSEITAFSSPSFYSSSIATWNKVSKKYLTQWNAKDDEDIDISKIKSYFDDDESETDLNRLTVVELRQRLRELGLKVSGKKSELIQRLLSSQIIDPELVGEDADRKKSPAQIFAEQHGKELVDVSAYIDPEDEKEETSEEVWGAEAKVISENDDTPVIDNLSRTTIEFRGANHDKVQAYVVASRDALKGYLSGGTKNAGTDKKPEEEVFEIQKRREQQSKIPIRPGEDDNLPDDPDSAKLYPLEREYSDWGVYTTTGAQISATEVEGILFLSDVRGPFSEDTRLLCERIAFECQPCVVMAPDLFRGAPWDAEGMSTSAENALGQNYEEWRDSHPEPRVNVDIRVAASVLRERYAVSSIAVFGTCYGGGRALEAAAGYLTDLKSSGPSPVHPSACIAWYPTRYDATSLFGKHKTPLSQESVAIMAIFAEKDVIAGATPSDAERLKTLLSEDETVKDYMVKVFSNQKHGFAHVGYGMDKMTQQTQSSYQEDDDIISEKDSAFLLSTAWIETYTRVFLPTVGQKVKQEEDWAIDLKMKDIKEKPDVRRDIDEALEDLEDSDSFEGYDYSDVNFKQW